MVLLYLIKSCSLVRPSQHFSDIQTRVTDSSLAPQTLSKWRRWSVLDDVTNESRREIICGVPPHWQQVAISPFSSAHHPHFNLSVARCFPPSPDLVPYSKHHPHSIHLHTCRVSSLSKPSCPSSCSLTILGRSKYCPNNPQICVWNIHRVSK